MNLALETQGVTSVFDGTLDTSDLFVYEPSLSSVSEFTITNLPENPSHAAQGIEWNKPAISAFSSFVSKRIGYLGSLQHLGDDWISGGGSAPSIEVISASQSLLGYIKNQLVIGDLQILPKVVMGPIPTGGITIELHSDEDNAIYVSIFNDSPIEFEVKHTGYYHTLSVEANKLPSKAFSHYVAISE